MEELMHAVFKDFSSRLKSVANARSLDERNEQIIAELCRSIIGVCVEAEIKGRQMPSVRDRGAE